MEPERLRFKSPPQVGREWALVAAEVPRAPQCCSLAPENSWIYSIVCVNCNYRSIAEDKFNVYVCICGK